jgi:hypothetical protein
MRSRRSRPTGFIAPCLPSAAERPPGEPGWIHEIKHRGYRVMARRSSAACGCLRETDLIGASAIRRSPSPSGCCVAAPA